MNKLLLEALKQVFPTVSDVFLNQMIVSCEKIKEESELFQAYGQFAFRLTPRKLISFEEIESIAALTEDGRILEHQEPDAYEKLFAEPKDLTSEDLVLYYEGDDQLIPDGEDFIPYFFSKGYEVIPDPHPSLLIDAMSTLTKQKLIELGIPSHITIILPSTIENSFLNEFNDPGFIGISYEYNQYKGTLGMFNASKQNIEWDSCAAFIVRKIK